MAQGDCEFDRTKYSILFPLRVDLSCVKPHRAPSLIMEAVVAGCKCNARAYATRTEIMVVLQVRHVLEGGAKVYAHMGLLDKTGSLMRSMDETTGKHREGIYLLTAQKDDVKANCVVDNHIVVQCSLCVNMIPVEQKIFDLGHDLAMMFDNQELTDVSFDVGGERFGAHRVVLATQSPVFLGELYGPTAESNMSSITIKGMHVSTFRSMLYYMYHGSLPDDVVNRLAIGDLVCSRWWDSTMTLYQHILVAADRYRIEGLKKTCEDKLCANGITVANVVSMLELAEEHVCNKLKNLCLDFLAGGENFKMVAMSGEYLRVMQSFPTLLVELQNRFKMALEKTTIMYPGAEK